MAENYYVYFENNTLKSDYPTKFKHSCEFETISGNYMFIDQDRQIDD